MDNLPNLYVRELENSRYSETSALANLIYDGYASSGANSDAFAVGNIKPHVNTVELPIPQGSTMGNTNMISFHVSKHEHNPCKDGKCQELFVQTDGEEDFLHSRQLDMIIGQNLSLQQPDVATVSSQGLSLSLGTRFPLLPLLHHYDPTCSSSSCLEPHRRTSGNDGPCRDENYQNETLNATSSKYNPPNLGCVIATSKYRNVAQELLQEVVSAQRTMKPKSEKSQSLQTRTIGSKEFNAGSKDKGMSSDPSDSAVVDSSTELSPSERQDLQNKVTRFDAYYTKVDTRYKEYFNQMQTVVSSFDVLAGPGAAKPYTTVALQTISSHFRCLRDAISSQIQMAKRSLGEQDNSGGKSSGMSRLQYIDQQLRQQKALQQFGLMQQHPWRTQRGLPDSSVSILRAWLFEHFLHPYPSNTEKLMLARQTGLSRGQISNWFINARVRLWKPMVEGMYKEEIGDTEINSNSSSENLHKGQDDVQSSENPHRDLQNNGLTNSSTSNMNSTIDATKAGPAYQPEAAAENNCVNLKTETMRDDSSFLRDALLHNDDASGRFVAYQMEELSSYDTGNQVSLTLGLQNCNNHPSFVGAQGQDICNVAAPIAGVANTTQYDYSSIRDRQQQFSSPHLLRDFVACKVRYT
ncbi:hypothetical protein ZIOFF_027115 [Zingiber officinale]|uniref:Homeobox domain-containing protein n=1 Tax=Zingiber officinale TaxID=94328 RepID=A0A8J5LFA6_ZINOF|nr:hypothetical protein ZIOFF_027115 [Zingiber officinale]